MAQKLTASIPDGLDLEFTYTLEFAAVDPTTGDDVAGVNVAGATFVVSQVTPGGAAALVNPVTPLFVPIPIGDLNAPATEEEGS